jgi:pentatricopeptide repeat protein
VKPDQFVFTIIFDICANLANERAFQLGRQVFSQMDKSHYQSTVVMTSVLNMFTRNGDVDKAETLFHSIRSKDLIMYATMMKGYTLNDYPSRALALFERMKTESINRGVVIYVLAIHACSQIGMIQCSRSIVAQIPAQFLEDQILRNALIDMWASGTSIGQSILYSLLTGKSWFSRQSSSGIPVDTKARSGHLWCNE